MRKGLRAKLGGLRVCLLVGLAASAGSTQALAQTIRGRVQHEASGAPIPGVLISVVNEDGERVRGVLTGEGGTFSVAVDAGRYLLRAERIGLEPTVTEVFRVGLFANDVQAISMTDRPIVLDGLVVDSRVQSCRIHEEEATRIQRWWSEIRTALDVSAALQREQFGQFIVENFERELDRRQREVLAERRHFEVNTSTRPFVSLPAEQLIEHGFIQGPLGPDRSYYGPDADVLLSTPFLSQHCFSLVERDGRAHQLGLRFEPVNGRELPDIEGTLWVDTTTAQLKDLDFEYVNLPDRGLRDAGGHIAFAYLPSGAWIVSDWAIRMPKTGRRGSRLTTIGFYEGGGSVTPLTLPERGGRTGSIAGVVWDSVRGGPLANATVTVLGSERSVTADAEGRFRLPEIPVGNHYLSFSSEATDLWDLGLPFTRVEVAPDATADIALGTPSFASLALEVCLAEGIEAETIVLGHVIGPDRTGRYGQAVQLVYEAGRGRSAAVVRLRATTDERGRFAVCGVPPDTPVVLRALRAGAWADITELTATEGEVTYREIWFTR